MKLTHRQEIFIDRFLDLYREEHRPIHYSILAKHVGVSPLTAYDMLRVLEEKGFVTSEYHLNPENPSVGRSKIVFYPTNLAQQRMKALIEQTDLSDWKNVKAQIQARISADHMQDQKLTEEILALVPPDAPSALQFCYEVIALMILHLGRNSGRKVLLSYAPHIMESRVLKSGLLILGGFVLGLLTTEDAGFADRNNPIQKYLQLYESIVMNMEPQLCCLLRNSIQEIFLLVG